ncbi:MAG TPA: NBR1-Ig-like domain-containing protein [Anaerolineales bacterium]|nr:NBR1-Ig-like domain-containing protein [Anaerolineales bacterium]
MLVPTFARQVSFLLLIAALALAGCNVGATAAPTVDANAINTAAFNTAMAQISAQQTMTALAMPSATQFPTNAPISLETSALPAAGASPTGNAGVLPTVSFNTTPNTTPLAGFTPLVTSVVPTSSGLGNTASGCNDGAFVGETLPDKSVVKAGKDFTKAWEIKNTGTCAWDEGYVFAFQPDLSSSEIDGYDIVIKDSDEITKPNHSQSFIIKLTAPSTPGEYKGYWKLKTDNGTLFGPLVYFDIIVK